VFVLTEMQMNAELREYGVI